MSGDDFNKLFSHIEGLFGLDVASEAVAYLSQWNPLGTARSNASKDVRPAWLEELIVGLEQEDSESQWKHMQHSGRSNRSSRSSSTMPEYNY